MTQIILYEEGKINLKRLRKITKAIITAEDINAKSPLTGNTSLHLACQLKSTKTVLMLLEYHPKLNVKNFMGETPILICAKHQSTEIGKLLLRYRELDVDAQDSNGISALMFSCRLKNLEFVEELLKANAQPNLTDQLGNSSLHIAAEVGGVKCVRSLLQNGASVNKTNFQSETASYIAVKNKQDKALIELLKYYPDLDITNLSGISVGQIATSNLYTIIETYKRDQVNPPEVKKKKTKK